MPKFIVYEVQEEHTTRKWMYEVEAEDCDAALEKVHHNDGGVAVEPIDCGMIGDPDYGNSGYAVREVGWRDPGVAEPWDEALSDMLGSYGCP